MQDEDHILDAGTLAVRGGGENQLSEGAAEMVTKAAKWGRYYLYIILAGIALQVVAQMASVAMGQGQIGIAELLGGLFVVALFYAYPVINFWQFTHKAKDAIDNDSNQLFQEAIRGLSKTFSFIGILTLIVIGLYVAFMAIFFIMGASSFFLN